LKCEARSKEIVFEINLIANRFGSRFDKILCLGEQGLTVRYAPLSSGCLSEEIVKDCHRSGWIVQALDRLIFFVLKKKGLKNEFVNRFFDSLFFDRADLSAYKVSD